MGNAKNHSDYFIRSEPKMRYTGGRNNFLSQLRDLKKFPKEGYQLNGIYAPGEEPLFENVGTSIIFKLPNGPGTLASALKCLEGIDLMHIESKPDNRGSFEFYAETATLPDDEDFKDAVAKLKEFTGLDVRIMTQGDGDDNLPWFPRHIAELDRFANQILS